MKNRIKVFRAMHDLTQENLANALCVTRQTILAIEKGKYDPSLELAFKIARYFKVPVEEIFIYESADTPGGAGNTDTGLPPRIPK
jgi:putative transcriptional regulator